MFGHHGQVDYQFIYDLSSASNIWITCVWLRSIKLTSIAGLTGLHNCDQAEVERHAAEVISHLTRLCLEAGDQVTADQSEHGIWSRDPVTSSYWPGPGPGDQRGGAPLHQLRARRPRHRGARVA